MYQGQDFLLDTITTKYTIVKGKKGGFICSEPCF